MLTAEPRRSGVSEVGADGTGRRQVAKQGYSSDQLTEVVLVKDTVDELLRLGRRLLVQLRPLRAELVRLVLPRLERRRVDHGRLDHLGAGEDSPRDGVGTGSRVGTEVALLVDGVVRDRRVVVQDLEELFDVLRRAEEFEIGLFREGESACQSLRGTGLESKKERTFW